MPFLNLDDNFAEHPKIHPLTDGAFRLHVSAMLYCARLKTDGKLPRSKVSGLTPHFRRAHVDALVRAKLWIPRRFGYEIHDFLDWNRSRNQIEQQQQRLHDIRSNAGKKGAQQRWQK